MTDTDRADGAVSETTAGGSDLVPAQDRPEPDKLAPVFAEALAHVVKAQNLMSLAAMPDIETADVSVIAQSAVVIEGETPADTLGAAAVWARTMAPGAVITSMAWAQRPGTVQGGPDVYQLTLHLSFPDPVTRETHVMPGRVVMRSDGWTA